jgi:hypothetical protein
MSMLKLGLAIVVAALCLGGRTAHAQAAPVSYWIPGWPLGFGGNSAGQSSNTYGNFPSFDFSDARGGFSNMRYNFSNGWFVGSEGGGMGLGMNGINQGGAFASSLSYQGVQVGYNFQNVAGSPLRVFAGFDTLKYNTGLGSSLGAFDTVSTTLPVYNVHAGIEFQPASNLSLSLGVGFTQQTGRIDSGINSTMAPGFSPLAISGRP